MLTHSVMLLRVKISYATTCTLQPLLIKCYMPWSLPTPGVLFLGRLKALGTWQAVYRTWKWVPGPWCILVTTVHDSFKFQEMGLPNSPHQGRTWGLWLWLRETEQFLSHPIRDHACFINCTLSSQQSGPRYPNQACKGIHYWHWILAKETRAWRSKNLALPIGLACWEMLTLSFKSPL